MEQKRSFFEMEAERLAAMTNVGSQPKLGFFGKLSAYFCGICLGLVILVPLSAYNFFAQGFVATKLWQWFVIPTFNFQPITLVQAGGIMLLVRLFTYINHSKDDKSDPNEGVREKLLKLFGILLVPWYTLFIGWLAHLFM